MSLNQPILDASQAMSMQKHWILKVDLGDRGILSTDLRLLGRRYRRGKVEEGS